MPNFNSRDFAVVVGVTVVYFLAAHLGFSVRAVNMSASPVWPPTGIALAAVLLLGYRIWPGILLGAFLAAFSMPGLGAGKPLALGAASLGVGFGNTLEALIGAWLVGRFSRGRAAFERPLSIFSFVALVMFSTALSPTLGLSSLSLAGIEKQSSFGSLWFTWWLGDLVSAMVLTPLLLVWSTKRLPTLNTKRLAELGALLLLLMLTCLVLFGGWLTPGFTTAPLALVLIPVLLWPALRFGQRGTATTIFLLACVAIFGTWHGWGPFALPNRHTSLLLLLEFIGVVAVLALVLAADVAQLQRADAGLRASEERYRILFEHSPQPMWVYDYDTLRFLAVNNAAVQHYGYSREEFLGMRITDIRPPEDVAALLDAVAKGRNGLGITPYWRHRKKDGGLIDVEVTRHNLVFDGRPAAMVLTTDVTERKRAEKRAAAFSDLGRRLSAADTPREAAQIIAETADALFGWDACFLNLCAPDQTSAHTILCIDTIDGRRKELIPDQITFGPFSLRAIKEGAQLVLRPSPPRFGPGGIPLGDTRRPSASLMHVPVRKDDQAIGVFSIQSYQPNAYTKKDLYLLQALADHCGGALDRIRAETDLRENDEQLRLALAASKMGTWSRELQGQDRVFWSPELEAIFGLKPGEFAGTEQAFLDLVHPEDRELVAQSIAQAISNKTDIEVEFRFLPRHREMGWMLARGRPYCDTQGKLVRLAGVDVDITAHKEAELEILRLNTELERRVNQRTAQLEAINKELEAFSYSVSHDLRAPLRAIRGFSDVLLERYANKLDARGQEFLRRACESAQYMDRLIEDLLKLSRLGRSEMHHQPVNLSALAVALARELKEAEPKRKVEWVIAPSLSAMGDERLLRQVLDNLLRNAWKFTGKKAKGRIEFGFTTDPEPAFFVRDNGAGFDMAYADKLFGVFQRLHSTSEFPGIGVGLAIVQRIINRHGGHVWASGAIDQGATFYFSLPGEASRNSQSHPQQQ